MTDVTDLDISGTREAIASGTATAGADVDAALGRIAALDPRFNAFSVLSLIHI